MEATAPRPQEPPAQDVERAGFDRHACPPRVKGPEAARAAPRDALDLDGRDTLALVLKRARSAWDPDLLTAILYTLYYYCKKKKV